MDFWDATNPSQSHPSCLDCSVILTATEIKAEAPSTILSDNPLPHSHVLMHSLYHEESVAGQILPLLCGLLFLSERALSSSFTPVSQYALM